MIRRRQFIAGLGGAVAWPVAVRAQQPGMPVIGFISWVGPARNSSEVEAFRAGLAEAGFIEGKNISIEYRWANNNFSSLPDMAADLVRRRVAVIVAVDALARSGLQRPPLLRSRSSSPMAVIP